jgi:DNA mismatch repair protein MutL
VAIEPFGEGLWAVRSIPELLQTVVDIPVALLELSRQPDPDTAAMALACRQALKNGKPLALPRAQELLDQWQQTRNPHTCPHGRPIYLSLSSAELGQYFRRRWRICDGLSDSFPTGES